MHEYGHVILHGFLFAIEDDLKKLFNGKPKDTRNTCRRDTMEGGSRDWMEWQAGFACGALLMPQTALTRVVRAFREAEDLRYADIGVNSEAGAAADRSHHGGIPGLEGCCPRPARGAQGDYPQPGRRLVRVIFQKLRIPADSRICVL